MLSKETCLGTRRRRRRKRTNNQEY